MALRLVNLQKQETFVFSQDPGKGTEDETRFHYRALDAYEQAYLQDRINTIENLTAMAPGETVQDVVKRTKTQTEIHKVAIEAFRIATTSFENLEDDTGELVEFAVEKATIGGQPREVLKMDIVRGLPVALCMEFYMELMQKNRVSADTEKNSAPASTPSNFSESETAVAALKPKKGSGATTKKP